MLDLAGLPPLDEADGVRLTPYFYGAPQPLHEFVASALLGHGERNDQRERFSLISADLHKVVRTQGKGERYVDLAQGSRSKRDAPRAQDAASPLALTRALDDWLREQILAAEAFRLRHADAMTTPNEPGDGADSNRADSWRDAGEPDAQ